MLSCLTERFPQTIAFAAKWHGYAPGYENTFVVDVVGKRKILTLRKSATGYGSSFMFLSLGIVNRLWKSRTEVIFTNSFGIWTILALLFKFIGNWRVIIAYEGSSPSVDYRQSPLRLALRRAMVKIADACISNSTAGEAYLTKVLNAPKDKTFAHPYEVPSGRALQGGAIALTRSVPTFLFVGSLTPRKGVHLLLQACVLLKQRGVEHYRLIVVGEGAQQDELQKFSQENGLSDRVQWIGRVEYHQLGQYFQQSDVFILPTLEDTWGVVVLEAMVLGKPVICSQWAGAAELIHDSINGYRFNPQEPTQLAEIMTRLIQQPHLAVEMGIAAYEHMKQYSPEAAAQFLVDVTEVVLGGKR
jgi:glycosyltransferase involved in cell wall biosynthesis